jgi:phosphatidylglycerol---prolipoprotein diacylglyceryl transferase
MVPGLVLAHAFGRLGCFGAGCCHGRATDLPWGMKFDSDLIEESLRGLPIHPTQLYESFALFALYFLLIRVFQHRKFDGQVLMTYFMTYPIIRSIIEIYRGDSIRGFIIGDWLSTSQFISILIFIAASVITWYRLKKIPTPVGAKKKQTAKL